MCVLVDDVAVKVLSFSSLRVKPLSRIYIRPLRRRGALPPLRPRPLRSVFDNIVFDFFHSEFHFSRRFCQPGHGSMRSRLRPFRLIFLDFIGLFKVQSSIQMLFFPDNERHYQVAIEVSHVVDSRIFPPGYPHLNLLMLVYFAISGSSAFSFFIFLVMIGC